MKRVIILLMICLITNISFGQKKHDKSAGAAEGPTFQQMDSAINAIYNSYDADRQQLQEQIEHAEDDAYRKALNFQWNALEEKCANRIWGYILTQPQSETTLQMMMRLRTIVDKEIVQKSLEQIKDKKLLQSKPAEVLSYYVSHDQAEVGKKFVEIEIPALGTEGKALKLSDEVSQRSILLIIGSEVNEKIPNFNVFYKKMDHDAIDVIQIGLYEDIEKAATAIAENKNSWRLFADTRGAFSPVILDYNVQDVPLCVLIEKGTGKITHMEIGVSDEMMGAILTH